MHLLFFFSLSLSLYIYIYIYIFFFLINLPPLINLLSFLTEITIISIIELIIKTIDNINIRISIPIMLFICLYSLQCKPINFVLSQSHTLILTHLPLLAHFGLQVGI